MLAIWLLTACHSRTDLFHSVDVALSASQINFAAASSLGKWPLALTARRIFKFKASMEFVVQITGPN